MKLVKPELFINATSGGGDYQQQQ